MEELPTSLLIQQEKSKPRTGEELETFGKYASKLYLGGQCSTLTEAVVAAVKTAGLAPEQVKRVVEFANTSAYLEKFASSGPEHKVVTFDGGPASFPDVIRDLNDGGGGSVFDKAASVHDYALPPPNVEALASRNLLALGLVDEKLASAFGVDEIPIPYAEPLREAADMKDKLAGVYDETVAELSGLETRYMDVCDLLFGQVKQAAMDGVPLGHVLQVWSAVDADPCFYKAAFEMLTPRLVENEVFKTVVDVTNSIEKTAGAGLVNPSHPMVGIFDDFCDTLVKMAAYRDVQAEVADQLDVLSVFIKKAAAAGKAAEDVVGYIPKAWRAATRAAGAASKPTERVLAKVIGPGAAKVVGTGVKISPHIAVGLAGEHAYQKSKNAPAARAVTNFVAGRIPYTHANMMRQYNMQMGM